MMLYAIAFGGIVALAFVVHSMRELFRLSQRQEKLAEELRLFSARTDQAIVTTLRAVSILQKDQ